MNVFNALQNYISEISNWKMDCWRGVYTINAFNALQNRVYVDL